MGAGELETTNAMLRSVIDGIADPIDVKDAEGRYLLVNPAAASAAGLRPDQILGYTDAQLLPDPLAASLRAADRRVMASERRRLLGRLDDIQEEERGRIAVGLHDGPLQGLATLGFKLARARALLAGGRARAALAVLGECEADVAGEVAALRRTMHDLRPLVLDQQALANVAEYAGAAEAEVRLEQSPAGEVLLTVSDDGCGFDPARVAGGGGFRFGLTVMTEQVEALGGRLAVRSRAGGGTTVEARILGLPARLEGRPA